MKRIKTNEDGFYELFYSNFDFSSLSTKDEYYVPDEALDYLRKKNIEVEVKKK